MLTDRRLIFDPLRITEAMSPLVAPYVRDAIKAAMRPLLLGEIESVRADQRRPSVLHIEARRGPMRYLVMTSRDAPPWGRRDPAARDEAVGAVLAALE